MSEDDDAYTSAPTHLRIYQELTGDDEVWHIDGADDALRYTVDVWRFASFEAALKYAPVFIEETTNAGTQWDWNVKRTTRLRRLNENEVRT